MDQKPLYFLTHEGNPEAFSGYGTPILEDEKSPLMGMLMVDRPEKCPDKYLRKLNDTFGELLICPMTKNGDRGIYTEMWIWDPSSLDLLRENIYDPVAEDIGGLLERALREAFLPNPKLKLHWSKKRKLWVSEFYLDHPVLKYGAELQELLKDYLPAKGGETYEAKT